MHTIRLILKFQIGGTVCVRVCVESVVDKNRTRSRRQAELKCAFNLWMKMDSGVQCPLSAARLKLHWRMHVLAIISNAFTSH